MEEGGRDARRVSNTQVPSMDNDDTVCLSGPGRELRRQNVCFLGRFPDGLPLVKKSRNLRAWPQRWTSRMVVKAP